MIEDANTPALPASEAGAEVTGSQIVDAARYYAEMREELEAKLEALPAGSLVRTALPAERLNAAFSDALRQSETAGAASPQPWFPPLVLFCARRTMDQLVAFEEDVQRVVRRTTRKPAAATTGFLDAGIREPGRWCGGLFEIQVKARLLRIPGLGVDFDVPLPNGRDVDAVVHWRGRQFPVECTVLTESDEDRAAWDRYLESRKIDANSVLVRPGPFDAEGSKSPSPYYDTVRVYAKVYDKLAPGLDPRKTQLLSGAPNLLLLSFWAPAIPLDARSLGVRWAVDELFGVQPRTRVRTAGDRAIDISLPGWLEYGANELLAQSRLTVERYAADYRTLVGAPRNIGGLLLFDQGSLEALRMNTEAEGASRLSYEEAAVIEDWFQPDPYWP